MRLGFVKGPSGVRAAVAVMPLVCALFLLWGVGRSDASSASRQSAQDGRPSWENNLNWWMGDNAEVYLAALSAQPTPMAISTILTRSLLDELDTCKTATTARATLAPFV